MGECKGRLANINKQTQNSINRGGEFEYQAPNFHSENLDDQEEQTSADKAFLRFDPLASVPLLALFLPMPFSLHSQRLADCVCRPWFDIPRWVLVYKTANIFKPKYRRPFGTYPVKVRLPNSPRELLSQLAPRYSGLCVLLCSV